MLLSWTPSLHKSAQVCDLGGAAACWLHSSSFNGAPVVSSHGSRERCFIERPEAQSVYYLGRRLQESVFAMCDEAIALGAAEQNLDEREKSAGPALIDAVFNSADCRLAADVLRRASAKLRALPASESAQCQVSCEERASTLRSRCPDLDDEPLCEATNCNSAAVKCGYSGFRDIIDANACPVAAEKMSEVTRCMRRPSALTSRPALPI